MQKDSIIFQALDWKEFNEDTQNENNSDSDNEEPVNSNAKYVIRLFGRTLDDKSVYVKVLNYTPHFYVELPPKWGDLEIDRLIGELKNRNFRMKENLIGYDVVNKYRFRCFNNNKKLKFLRIIFNNSKVMYSFARTLSGRISIPGMLKMIKLDVYESNIDTFLRCIHIRNLNACGWIKINDYIENEDELSTCDINISCDWKALNANENQNLGGAPFKICSFDIECTSGDGSFPQAERIQDKIIQIGSVFSRYGGDIYKKHMITLGSCDPIEGVEVVSVNTERELLLEWTKIIKKEDPDILTGYNIWGFDEPYMYNRSKHHEINCANLFSKLSKLYTMDCQFVEKKLSSAALGDNVLRYIDSFGRVQIDLMKVVQRDYKLSKYSLDAVSENFIQDKIIKYNILSPTQLEIESKNLNLLKVGNYIKLIANVELEYGVKEELEEEDEGYCDEKYRIISIISNKMIVENDKINFKTDNMADLGKDIKWGLVKDDIKVNDIFRYQKMGSGERKIIAEYCIQDCVLVSRLLAKLEIVTNSISMANVCHVPLYYLLIRGQGIKSLSLVSKKCRQKQFLIPVLSKDTINDMSYEGATVFDPKTGFYQTYIPVLDYNSLYPSSIIDRNISHETIVIEPQYDNLPNCTYNEVSYNNSDGTVSKCRYVKEKDKIGILQEILQELLSERKATRKLMEKEPDPFKRSILDGKQLALKVTANSLYGQLGAATSPICMKELAASTTATGREMLETARYFVENDFVPILDQYHEAFIKQDNAKIEELNNKFLKDTSVENLEFIRCALGELFEKYKIDPHIIYGDSCTGDTPLMLQINGKIIFQTFNDFNQEWSPYNQFKNINAFNDAKNIGLIDSTWNSPDNNGSYKEQINMIYSDIKIWSSNGWAKVNRIIRHKTDKKIYRVLTDSGCNDVTEDHSLLDKNCDEIKPKDCSIGQELLHNEPYYEGELMISIENRNEIITADKMVAQKYYMYLKKMEYNVVINLHPHNNQLFVIRWNNININENVNIWNLDVYGALYKKEKKSKSIKQIFVLHEKYEDYVYDVETENGTFHAGIGSMILKNTDSVFCDMRIKFLENDNLVKSKDGLIHGIKLGQLASIFIKKRLRHPHNLEYEKTFYPFCIMSKKRYVGNKYEENPNKYKQSSMGIVLKRRDNANIVKKVIGGLVNIMMNENDIDKALTYIKSSIENLLDGNYPITDFITTKTIRATYKGIKLTSDSKGKKGEEGTWAWDDVECSQSHVKLSQRMKKRDPGNAPSTNDRIPLVAVVVQKKKSVKLLQGDMIEHPEYIKEQNLKVNYLFYLTNQIMNPAVQFLDTLMKNADKLFKDYISLEELKQNGGISLNNFVVHSNHNHVNLIEKNNDNITIDAEDYDINLRPQDPLEMYDTLLNKKRVLSNKKPVIDAVKPKRKAPVKRNKASTASLYVDIE